MLTTRNYEEKPYNQCLDCMHIGKQCDGPNFLAMSIERWCEWARLRKEYLGWTNAMLAEIAGVSKVSVDRITAGTIKDVRITTMQAVTKALVNGTWGQYPCALAASHEPNANELALECEHLKKELTETKGENEKKIEYLKQQVVFFEKQLEAKDELLKDRYKFIKRKDSIITLLAIVLSCFLLLFFADIFIGDVGYFRY